MSTRIGRLAPSPTGALHLGNIRTFMIAWLQMRACGGQIRMRIEDLDHPKHKPGATAALLDDLQWLGFDWDGPIVTQSHRHPLYQTALEQLIRNEQVYPCICSRRDIQQAASAPHAGEILHYPGTCRGRFTSGAAALKAISGGAAAPHSTFDIPHASGSAAVAWRFKIPTGSIASLIDRFAGPYTEEPSTSSGDFVVARGYAPLEQEASYACATSKASAACTQSMPDARGGAPASYCAMPVAGGSAAPHSTFHIPHSSGSAAIAYTLAVVLDDAEMGVTDVVRGDDLLAATPSQLHLYQAFGKTPPTFCHVPLVIGTDGRRLAKRHGDTRISTYRAAGITPEQIIGTLARSCRWTNSPTMTLGQLIPHFDLATIPHSPLIWQETLL